MASHLTAALLDTLAVVGGDSAGSPQTALGTAAADLREFGDAAVPPADVTELCRQVGRIPGTDLSSLIAKLSPDPQAAEQALRDLIPQAQRLAAAPEAADS